MSLTEEQQNAVNDLETHIKFFPKYEDELGKLLEAKDVAGLRKLVDTPEFKASLSKRGFKLVTKFNNSFTEKSSVPIQKIPSKVAGKTSSTKEKVLSKDSLMLKKIIQHLMQFEK